ncbi:MAG: NUDIX domain-containing protein [Patescibacteria group bacterium]
MGEGDAFVPKSGQVDFTNLRFRPAISCVVKNGDKILLVRRSANMNIYPGFWNAIGGYLDDGKTIEEKVKEELCEETGITEKDIISIRTGPAREMDEEKYQKTWIIHPVLVEVNTDKIVLDWEADSYRWVTVEEARREKNVVPSLPGTLNVFFPV